MGALSLAFWLHRYAFPLSVCRVWVMLVMEYCRNCRPRSNRAALGWHVQGTSSISAQSHCLIYLLPNCCTLSNSACFSAVWLPLIFSWASEKADLFSARAARKRGNSLGLSKCHLIAILLHAWWWKVEIARSVFSFVLVWWSATIFSLFSQLFLLYLCFFPPQVFLVSRWLSHLGFA